jgi:hypothetical protein
MVDESDDFVCVFEPSTTMDVALIHALLSGSGIRYFIQNENNAQWGDGTLGIADGAMRLMVEAGRKDEVRELMRLT